MLKVIIALCMLTLASRVCGNLREEKQLFQQNNNLSGGFNLNRIQDKFMNDLLRGENSECNGTGAFKQSQGVCKPLKVCRKKGGTPSGSCASVNACCILEQSCINETNATVSYFTSTNTFQSNCQFRINLYSRDVCQIRLDFEQFIIEGPPSNDDVLDCTTDAFTVTWAQNLGFQALCGINTGQHIYIPVNSTTGSNTIVLNMLLQQDRSGLTNPLPSWRIRVTQLECGMSSRDFSNIQSSLTTLYETHKNRKGHGAVNDNDLIAPTGCLQYYTERQGTYESFNFNNGNGLMIANTNYAICFKRSQGDCGISHTVQTFELSSYGQLGFDGDCTQPNVNQDWLMIPGGITAGMAASYYCGFHSAGTLITSKSAGPFTAVANTDNLKGDLVETGFRNSYNILNIGC